MRTERVAGPEGAAATVSTFLTVVVFFVVTFGSGGASAGAVSWAFFTLVVTGGFTTGAVVTGGLSSVLSAPGRSHTAATTAALTSMKTAMMMA